MVWIIYEMISRQGWGLFSYKLIFLWHINHIIKHISTIYEPYVTIMGNFNFSAKRSNKKQPCAGSPSYWRSRRRSGHQANPPGNWSLGATRNGKNRDSRGMFQFTPPALWDYVAFCTVQYIAICQYIMIFWLSTIHVLENCEIRFTILVEVADLFQYQDVTCITGLKLSWWRQNFNKCKQDWLRFIPGPPRKKIKQRVSQNLTGWSRCCLLRLLVWYMQVVHLFHWTYMPYLKFV